MLVTTKIFYTFFSYRLIASPKSSPKRKNFETLLTLIAIAVSIAAECDAVEIHCQSIYAQ